MKTSAVTTVIVTMVMICGMLPATTWPGDSDRTSVDCSLRSIEWMIGRWRADSGADEIFETWQAVSETTFEGTGMTVSKESGETTGSEDLRLVEMGGEFFYIAKVSHNPYPVAFKMIKCSSEMAVFVNTEHDFPTRLEYRLVDEDRMIVDVSGSDGEGFTLKFFRVDDRG